MRREDKVGKSDIELGKRYNEIEKQIEALEKEKAEIWEQMPKLYYVKGSGNKAMPKGIYFAAESRDECVAWLKDNWPEFEMKNVTQFNTKDQLVHDNIAGWIHQATPAHEEWPKISVMKAKQG
jgi:hypothetical protein